MLRRLSRDATGVVLIEFALVLPILLVMYMGAYAVADLVACNRKVAVATTTLADLVSRNMSPTLIAGAPTTSTASSYLGGGALVLNPYPLSNATETITLLRICSTTKAYVVWSQTQTQNNAGDVASAPITAGSTANPTIVTLPTGLLTTLAGSSSYYPLAPTSTTQANTNINICANTSSSGNTPVVGSTGAYMFLGKVDYTYTPSVEYPAIITTQMSNNIYMIPRRN